ncbi:hypothetical protein SNE40_001560 [Patella caerulea]|uniref:FP protein C-terminal domain-containing protein n=1 Tax=Patella caerulea TaxID=87958 RepID=A0AAN8KHU8_PATCE
MIHDLQNRTTEIESERDENSILQAQLQDKIGEMESELKESINRHEDLEQYTLRNSLRFMHVPNKENLNTDSEVIQICDRCLGVSIGRADIDRTHTIGNVKGEHVQIIPTFTSHNLKSKVYTAKRKLKGNVNGIFTTEDLTNLIKRLIQVNKAISLSSFWSNNGRIFVCKERDSKPIQIKCVSDIDNLSTQ